MRSIITAVLLLLLIAGEVRSVEVSERDVFLEALKLSFDEAKDRRLDYADKTVVIMAKRQFIVVSFIVASEGARGGMAHFVYDPTKRRVVHVSAEQ